ncbi:MAG TPA: DUF4112 domain-containing protein [Candidatus Limnocylindrales bacterium]|jgi:hypothetical protein
MTATSAGRTERVLAAERRIAAVAHLLDDIVRIPGTGVRVGLDPIIGLVPFLGDLTSGAISAWIVIEAARFRLPGVVLARMIMYATVDFLVGLIPFLGDLFDVGFKANTRNLALFHRHAVDPGASTSSSWALVGGVALAFGGLLWLGIVAISKLLSIVVG